MIRGQQELLSAFEKLNADELMLHSTKEREYNDQNQSTIELEVKISASQNILYLLKKRSSSAVFEQKSEDVSAEVGKKVVKTNKPVTDLSAMLNMLR